MKLVGISACLPKNVVEPSLAYERFKPFDVDRIVGNTGVLRKREADPGVTATDLCIQAAGPLLDELGWARDSVDALILCTTLPDYITPASSHRAQHELGLGARCLVFDITLACSGFTHGLLLFQSLIKSGLIKRGLLLCGEATTDRFRPRIANTEYHHDLANALLFGDAGTAIALSNEGDDQVRATSFGADGSGMDAIIVPGGGAKSFWTPALFERTADEEGDERRPIDLILRGPQVLTFTMKRVPPMVKDLFEQSGWTPDDIDAYVPHQANKFMIDFLVKRMKLPLDKVLLSIEEYGNTSSASIPLTMLTRGGKMLQQRTKWALMGFGVGLSWSGLFMETDGIVTPPVLEV
jgi:3-oxoacyl-[acyl-carrier-protein] synthase-3